MVFKPKSQYENIYLKVLLSGITAVRFHKVQLPLEIQAKIPFIAANKT